MCKWMLCKCDVCLVSVMRECVSVYVASVMCVLCAMCAVRVVCVVCL